MNRSPTAADGLPNVSQRIAIMQRTTTKHPTNTHETPNEHPRNAQ
ncbi:hypothetical protein [Prevotella pallens]|nr:hypothetical protein [Prevotella pallens]